MKIKCALIAVWLFLTGLSAVAGAEEITFNSLLPPASAPISIQNAEYLAEEIQGRADVKDFFSDINRAKKVLFLKLKPLSHFYNRLPCLLSAEPKSISHLSLPQLLRVYLIFEALENGNLVNQIGKIIEEYKEGNYYEPGGVGLLKNGQVVLCQIPSDSYSKTPDIEAFYLIPNLEFLRPHIFTFHMHPLGRSGPMPGPSWTVKIDDDAKEAKFDFDIGAALLRAKNHGDYHHLLISKMYNRYFNVDYYVAQKLPEPPSYDPSDYCHKLVGFKIIDLGVWRY